MKKISNTFEISGFLANDAQIRNFDTASVARFAISVSRAEKDQTGETAFKSALLNIVAGYFKPEEWTGTDGKKNQRVVLVATKFHRTPEAEEKPEAPAKKASRKSKKAA